MFDYAQAAVEGALAAGASYADARVVIATTESIDVQNQVVESLDHTESAGVGVRALIGSSWGFYATADLTTVAAGAAGAMAARIAQASATVPGPPAGPGRRARGHRRVRHTPTTRTRLAVPLSEKVDLLVDVTRTMQAVPGVAIARGNLTFWDTEKWFVSSQGHRITAASGRVGRRHGRHRRLASRRPSAVPTRSRSASTRPVGTRSVRRCDLPGNAQRIAEEAAALLTAPVVPGGRERPRPRSVAARPSRSTSRWATPSSSTASSAGRRPSPAPRFLDLDKLGPLRYGSELMNITADATLPGALGTFGYDDEGTAGATGRHRPGRHLGRGPRPGATRRRSPDSLRAAWCAPTGYNRLPMVRMTNVGLVPGDGSSTRSSPTPTTGSSWPPIAPGRSTTSASTSSSAARSPGRSRTASWAGCCATRPTPGSPRSSGASMDRLAGEREWVHLGHAELREGPADAGRPTPAIRRRPPGSRERPGGGEGMSRPHASSPPVGCSIGSGARAAAEVRVAGRDVGADPLRQLVHPPERR